MGANQLTPREGHNDAPPNVFRPAVLNESGAHLEHADI
jgi:hypothetical protein